MRLWTLHCCCACSACSSWLHVVFQTKIPVKWLIRVLHLPREGWSGPGWVANALHSRLCSGERLLTVLWYVKPGVNPVSPVLGAKVRVRTRQTETKSDHASQDLAILIKLSPVSGLSIFSSFFLKVYLTYATFWRKCVPSTLSKEAPYKLFPQYAYFLYFTTLIYVSS